MNHLYLSAVEIRSHRRFSTLAAIVLFLALPAFCVAQEEDDSPDDAVAIFNQGQDAHEKGDFAGAIALYEKALKIIPEFPEAEYQRGTAFLSLRKTDDAEKSFRRALAIRPEWTLAMGSLGSILVQKGQFEEAEKVLVKAIELNDQNFPAYVALAELRIRTNADQALLRELLSRIIVLTSKASPTSSIWAARGTLENALGDRGAAKASLGKALEIDPKEQTALHELANIALAEDDPGRARQSLKTLEAISPNSSSVKFLEVRILVAEGKFPDALKILDSIKDPSADSSAMRTQIIAATSSNPADLEKQLEANAKDAAALGRLCSLLRIDAPAKALDYCRRASEAEPSNVRHAIGYAAALVQTKRYDEAVALLKKLLTHAPDNSTLHANLATALFQLKRYQEAKAEYLWLTEKQPDLAGAYYFLAITHDQLGEYLDAAANYNQFLKLADPEQSKLEIEKVNLRMPILLRQIKDKKGKRNE
jgi:tetratricopeptide (TPR) repeat protein